ncbi:MAG TPA: hypothetical protein VMZ53_21015 [Kofleriaceae bacterium]|nr:hypothetical protein [Kofleriaceae bacterium]
MAISNAMELATIDFDLLSDVTGGDGWEDYKSQLSRDWQDTKSRANEAIKYNAVNGNWNAGKFADNAAGTLYNGAKMALDAIPVLGPAITNRL